LHPYSVVINTSRVEHYQISLSCILNQRFFPRYSILLLLSLFQPQHKKLFEEIDENKDGNLVKHELRDHVQRVREKNNVASGQNTRGGPTTPMN
jgi:hypothetical protein